MTHLPYPPFLPAKETVPEAVAYTGAASPTAMSIPEWKLRLPVMGWIRMPKPLLFLNLSFRGQASGSLSDTPYRESISR